MWKLVYIYFVILDRGEKMHEFGLGEGLEGRAASTGLWGLPEEKQDKHLQTILQIGRNIIYMVQLYKSVTLGQLIFIL
jgi:hypothetical protein